MSDERPGVVPDTSQQGKGAAPLARAEGTTERESQTPELSAESMGAEKVTQETPPAELDNPAPAIEPPIPPTDTVGIWRHKRRRRVEILKFFGGVLAASLTLFAAVKISETSTAATLAPWMAPTFQTAVFISAFFLFLAYGSAQWDVDLLNRYLPHTDDDGQAQGAGDAPLKLKMPLTDAKTVLMARGVKLHRRWPSRNLFQFYMTVASGGAAALLLLAYVWLPQLGAQRSSPQPVETLVGVTASVHFEHNRADMPADTAQRLSRLARSVLPKPGECFLIEGHADSDGSGDYNLELSRLRTEVVRKALIDDGVPLTRIATIPYGETRPRAAARSESAKAENRRVDVSIERCK